MKTLLLKEHSFPVKGTKYAAYDQAKKEPVKEANGRPKVILVESDNFEIDELDLVLKMARYKHKATEEKAMTFGKKEMIFFSRVDKAIATAEETKTGDGFYKLELEDGDFQEINEKLNKFNWPNAAKEWAIVAKNLYETFDKAQNDKTELPKNLQGE